MSITFPSHHYNDKTEENIDTETLKYFWAGFCLFIMISSWAGDTTILIASIKYKAFKLHKVIVVIIQHIAICDLILSPLTTLPRFISLFAGKWVFGSFLCQWITYAEYYFNPVNMFLICSMTTSKLLLLKYPLRFGTASLKRAHLICGVAWIAALVLPATLLLVDADDMHFSYDIYRCYYGFTLHKWQYLRPILAFSFLFAPTCLVVATSLNLLVIAKRIARRGRESLKWQGITTTLLTAAVFCLSFLPYLVLQVILEPNSRVTLENRRTFVHLRRVATVLPALDIMANFFIYSLTVQSFRVFVLSRLQYFVRVLTHSGTNIWMMKYAYHDLRSIINIKQF